MSRDSHGANVQADTNMARSEQLGYFTTRRNNEVFAELPIKDRTTYDLGDGVTVDTVEDSSSSGTACRLITIGRTKDGLKALPNHLENITDVIDCNPHNGTFKKPIYITLPLPLLVSNSGQEIRILYSPTDRNEPHAWQFFKLERDSESGRVFTDNRKLTPNKAVLQPDRRKVVLVLRHFCSFVVAVNYPKVCYKEIMIMVFLKLIEHPSKELVNIQIIIGCNSTKRVS